MYCPTCGTLFDQDAAYCKVCGTARNAQAMAQIPVSQPAFIQKERHTKFMFVSSLVFMIFLASIAVSSLVSIHDLVETGNIFAGFVLTMAISITAAIISFALILTFFVLSANAKNINNPIERRVKTSKLLWIFSVITVVGIILYLASEIVLLAVFVPKFTNAKELTSQFTGSITFLITFLIFACVNMYKARTHMNYLIDKNNNI